MTRGRMMFGILWLLLIGSSLVAQRPGDPVEYRAERWPEKWQVVVYVRPVPGGKQAVIREAPSEFFPQGFERAYDLSEFRPTSRPGSPAPASRPAVVPPPPGAVAPAMAGPRPASAPVSNHLTACGPRPNPAADRLDCVRQVQGASPHWGACEAGDPAACHRFVRDVARALATGDPRWGLITKPRGQQSCTTTECGRHVSGGFGEDMVAYLPTGNTPQQWLGTDIVGGAGAAGARPQWSNPEGFATNRPDNLWSPMPR